MKNTFYSRKVVIRPICKENARELVFLFGSPYMEKYYNYFHCINKVELEMILNHVAKDMTGYVVYSTKTKKPLGTMIFEFDEETNTYTGFVVVVNPDDIEGLMKKAFKLLYGRKFFKENAIVFLGVKPGDTRHQEFIDSVKNLIEVPCAYEDAKQYLFVIY